MFQIFDSRPVQKVNKENVCESDWRVILMFYPRVCPSVVPGPLF